MLCNKQFLENLKLKSFEIKIIIKLKQLQKTVLKARNKQKSTNQT